MCFLVAWFKIIRYQLQGFYVLYKESLCNRACICQLCCVECLHIAFGKCSGKSDNCFSWFSKSLPWNNPESSHVQIPWITFLILDTALHLPEAIYHLIFWSKILHMLLLIVTVCISSSVAVHVTFAPCTILWLEFLSSSKVKYLMCNLPVCFIERRSYCVPGRMQE